MKSIKTVVFSVIAGLSFSSLAMAGEAELDGYCPVCYISAGKAVQGVEKFKSEYKGETYYFVHADAKAAFDKTPAKFIPAYGGYCAYGITLGKKFEADPTQFTVVDGVIYMSSNADIKKKFDADSKGYIAKAGAKWEMISKADMAKKEEMMKKEEMKK